MVKEKSYTEKKIEQAKILPKANTIFDNGKHSEIKTTMSAESVQKNKDTNMSVINDDVDLNKLFSSELGNENDILKELFTYDSIKTKTALTRNDISIISRLEIQAHMTQNRFLKAILTELEILRVSENRAGRGEFVQAFGGVQSQAKSGMIENIGKIFKDKV
jgi:hypothetical protein